MTLSGTAWPGMKVALEGSYAAEPDIEACSVGNWPVGDARGKTFALGPVTTQADDEGRYQLSLELTPPDDGGQCQWKLRSIRGLYRPADGDYNPVRLSLFPRGSDGEVFEGEVRCYVSGPPHFSCTTGNSFSEWFDPAMSPWRARFDIQRVKPDGTPLDAHEGSEPAP